MTRFEELELINKYADKLLSDLQKGLAKCHKDVKELTSVNRRLRNIIREKSKRSK